MEKLILRSFRLTICDNNTPEDLEDFNDEIEIYIRQENELRCE